MRLSRGVGVVGEVVQLTGALSRPDVDDSSIELVREVARTGGGPAYFFYAPLCVADAATAAARAPPGWRSDSSNTMPWVKARPSRSSGSWPKST